MTNPLFFEAVLKDKGGDHYKGYVIEPAEFIIKNKLDFPTGNAIKYLLRHSRKGKKKDLEKAKHYIYMIIARDYK